MRFAGLPALLMMALMLAMSALWASPAQARSAVTGVALTICVAPARDGDKPAAMFASQTRFDCNRRQTSFGSGDYWVVSQPLAGVAGLEDRSRVRVGSLWQDAVTLYALYPGGKIRGWRFDGRQASRHLQLGAMIEWPLPTDIGPPVRLMWRVEGSANLRGILIAPTIATPHESGQANLAMAAIYAAFGGLCLALLDRKSVV